MANPPIVFLRDIPNDDEGQDFIATLKKSCNKDRYRVLVRGGKPVDKKDWNRYPFGIPMAKSKTLRLYVFDKLKDKEIQNLQRKIWKLKDELTDLQKTVVEQEKVIERREVSYKTTIWDNYKEDPVETVEYHEYEIEIDYSYMRAKYNYKIWDCQHDKYVYDTKWEWSKINEAIADAKYVIDVARVSKEPQHV